MDSSDKFWLSFWTVAALTICILVCVPTYIVHNNQLEMHKAGYIQKLIVTRPGNDWISPITEKVWVKVGEEPLVEKKQ